MKLLGIEKEKSRLPEVGELWKHRDADAVYLRIADKIGNKYFDYLGGKFYSVNIKNGLLFNTNVDSEDIEVLGDTVSLVKE